MRKWAITGLLVLLAAMLSGCGAGEAADTYVEGSDYQCESRFKSKRRG